MKFKGWFTMWPVWLVALLLCTTGISGQIDHVVIISMDGARSDYVIMASSSNIQAMVKQGAFTWWAQTIKQSSTLPSHSSMLTGSQSDKHGITWNGWKPEKGFVKTTTCFELAKNLDGNTAMFVGKEKLRHIAKPGTVDKFEFVNGDANKIALAAAAYFNDNCPVLMFVHFPDPDGAGHGNGWGSAPYMEAIRNCDRGIGIVWSGVKQAGVEDCTLLIITADHGGRQCQHGSTDIRDMTIPWIAYSPGNVIPGEIQNSVITCDTAATALYALGLSSDPRWDGKALCEIFTDYSSVKKP